MLLVDIARSGVSTRPTRLDVLVAPTPIFDDGFHLARDCSDPSITIIAAARLLLPEADVPPSPIAPRSAISASIIEFESKSHDARPVVVVVSRSPAMMWIVFVIAIGGRMVFQAACIGNGQRRILFAGHVLR